MRSDTNPAHPQRESPPGGAEPGKMVGWPVRRTDNLAAVATAAAPIAQRAATAISMAMPISQNLLFTGDAEGDDECSHPAGISIAKLLKKGLANRGWKPSEIDNWRDCGWSIDVAHEGCSLLIAFAATKLPRLWLLQVAASYHPGFLGRLFGKQATAGPKEILALARDVGKELAANERFSDFKWRWDGFPEEDVSTREPLDPNECR